MDDLNAYLVKRDGSVTRSGKAIARVAKTTGYSVESLRSFAYGRRSPRDGCPRARKLRTILRRAARRG